MAQLIITHSPKTAGNTIFTLNMSLLQSQETTAKIACVQLGEFPDLDIYSNQENVRNLSDLVPFLQTEEWGENLFPMITKNIGIDLFFSPETKILKNIDLKDFQKIWELIFKNYDVIYLDLSHGVPEKIKNYLFPQAEKILLVSTLDPLCLKSVLTFSQHNFLDSKKLKLILNQCPKNGISYAQKKLETLQIPLLGILPLESKYMWSQVYEGFPLVFQKKSAYKKALIKILEKII